jgi:hypothetical protein
LRKAFAHREDRRPGAITAFAALIAVPLMAWFGMASEMSLSKNRPTRNAIFCNDNALVTNLNGQAVATLPASRGSSDRD